MDVSLLFGNSGPVMHKTPRLSAYRSNKNSKISACARHFRRESLFSKGTRNPEDVVQRCLTHFRKCDLPSLAPYLPQLSNESFDSPGKPNIEQRAPPILIGTSQIYEQGPLASLQPILDIGARRILPGHLLRRSRVLGTLRVTPRDFQQRIALTAQTGEESVCTWHLQWIHDEGSSGIDDSYDIDPGRWVINKIERESEELHQDGEKEKINSEGTYGKNNSNTSLPSTPQPKSSPEAVIYAQLEALRRGDVYEASLFNTWRGTSMVGDDRPSFSLGMQFELLRDSLVVAPYNVLVNHSSAVLGAAALPTQRTMLQEVWVKSKSSSNSGGGDVGIEGNTSPSATVAAGDWVRFIWNLSIESSNGCWMCTCIEPYLDT